MIRAGDSAGLGALLGGASEPTLDASQRFGRSMGIALHMLDDFNSLLSDDKRHIAPTLDPSLWSSLVEEVMRVRAGANAEPLVLRLLQLLDNRGPSIIEQHFALAWQELQRIIGNCTHLLQMRDVEDRFLNGFLTPAKSA